MYQVIARKYRPQTFDDVVGQEHVKSTLENAITQKRIAHGYIFSGQRGTGKTTIARILARSLNCESGPTATPCGTCASCREITGGGSVDVIEIDAASNRGINEMRELRENVRYQPARDRYKVFIVDEAHQITNEAFNALLKTIEEPPPWAVFVLCTTEAHKIPATIASRCQHFSFRSVDFEALTARMQWICEQEGVDADPAALVVLAQAGEGSVRDSLSALDQAIACCGNHLDAESVRSLLGAFSLDSLEKVSAALAAGDSGAMLDVVDQLERNGLNLQHFSRELSRYFRNLLVARISGAETRLIAASAAERARMVQTASQFSEEDLTRYLQLSLDLFRDLQFSLQPRFHLEIGLVRLVQAGRLLPIEEALANLTAAGPAAPRAAAPAPVARPAAPPRAPAAQATPRSSAPSPFEADRARKASAPPRSPAAPAPVASAPAPQDSAAAATPEPPASSEWRVKLHAALMELKMPFTADAIENSSVEEKGGELVITTSKMYQLALRREDLDEAVRQVGGRALRIRVVIGEVAPQATPLASPKSAAEDDASGRALADPEVQRFRDVFGGEVRTVRNLKE
jgi:DNA polymerase III subunit gamma/tau